ncbi:MAG: Inner membrane protein CreD, partial [Escherichia coli DORA_A_5_14_21]
GIGVVKAPEVNGTALTIEPGTGLEQGGQGVHIPLPEGGLAQAEPEAEYGTEFKRYRRSFCGACRA